MPLLDALYQQIDALFQSAEIDYRSLRNLPLDRSLFNDYDRQRIVNSYLFNFIKLQDKIGAKLFREALNELKELEETMAMRDVLDRMEKLQIIDSALTWERLREIRNAIAHEYPLDYDERLENIAMALEGYEAMKAMYENIKMRVKARE